MIIFTYQSTVEFLSKIKTLCVDEMFEHCTQSVCKFFTIHDLYNNYYMPFVYFLLKDIKNNQQPILKH